MCPGLFKAQLKFNFKESFVIQRNLTASYENQKIDGDGDMLINLHSVDPLLQRKPCPNKPILFIDYLTLGLFFFL